MGSDNSDLQEYQSRPRHLLHFLELLQYKERRTCHLRLIIFGHSLALRLYINIKNRFHRHIVVHSLEVFRIRERIANTLETLSSIV